jgi:hypothetical protein
LARSLRACFSIAGNTLSAGQSLSFSKNEIILSQGGTFELGFFTPGSSVKIYLGIRYKWFVPKEVVWVAYREGWPCLLKRIRRLSKALNKKY